MFPFSLWMFPNWSWFCLFLAALYVNLLLPPRPVAFPPQLSATDSVLQLVPLHQIMDQPSGSLDLYAHTAGR